MGGDGLFVNTLQCLFVDCFTCIYHDEWADICSQIIL